MPNSDLVPQIDDAIHAHLAMRRTLEIAVVIGKAHESTAHVGDDHRCAFGRWLHGHQLDPAIKGGKPYQVVARLHREFHAEAERVAEQAALGNATEAERILHDEFNAKSEILLKALNKWKGEAGG